MSERRQMDECAPVRRNNHRYLGDLAPENESWWSAYGRAMEEFRDKYDGKRRGK